MWISGTFGAKENIHPFWKLESRQKEKVSYAEYEKRIKNKMGNRDHKYTKGQKNKGRQNLSWRLRI